MLGHNFEKPKMEKNENQPNCQNAMGTNAAEGPPEDDQLITSRKCLLKINSLWFIMICEKRRRRPIDVDSDDVVIITVE